MQSCGILLHWQTKARGKFAHLLQPQMVLKGLMLKYFFNIINDNIYIYIL